MLINIKSQCNVPNALTDSFRKSTVRPDIQLHMPGEYVVCRPIARQSYLSASFVVTGKCSDYELSRAVIHEKDCDEGELKMEKEIDKKDGLIVDVCIIEKCADIQLLAERSCRIAVFVKCHRPTQVWFVSVN